MTLISTEEHKVELKVELKEVSDEGSSRAGCFLECDEESVSQASLLASRS